jgi:hypothetical protein
MDGRLYGEGEEGETVNEGGRTVVGDTKRGDVMRWVGD